VCVIERITEEIANEFPIMAFQGRDEAWSTYRTEIPTQVRLLPVAQHAIVSLPCGLQRLTRALLGCRAHTLSSTSTTNLRLRAKR
jgi:hypothetical protein